MAPTKRAESPREERAGKRQDASIQTRIDQGLRVKATKNLPGRKPAGGKAPAAQVPCPARTSSIEADGPDYKYLSPSSPQ